MADAAVLPATTLSAVEAPRRPTDPAPLPVFALPSQHPVAGDLRGRSGRLFDASAPLPDTVAWTGDHVLNPDWGGWTTTPKAAAVIVLLTADARGEPALLFIERAAHLSSHAGQIGLPGGKVEAGETAAMTALREAQEEVRLPPDAVEPLGLADPYMTRTGFLVTPLIGILKRPSILRPDPGEVADAFLAPWAHVMNAANTAEIALTLKGRERRALELMWEKKRIWGVTAGILRVVQERLYPT